MFWLSFCMGFIVQNDISVAAFFSSNFARKFSSGSSIDMNYDRSLVFGVMQLLYLLQWFFKFPFFQVRSRSITIAHCKEKAEVTST